RQVIESLGSGGRVAGLNPTSAGWFNTTLFTNSSGDVTATNSIEPVGPNGWTGFDSTSATALASLNPTNLFTAPANVNVCYGAFGDCSLTGFTNHSSSALWGFTSKLPPTLNVNDITWLNTATAVGTVADPSPVPEPSTIMLA